MAVPVLRFSGLYFGGNPALLPEGSCAVAKNVLSKLPATFESRRGFTREATAGTGEVVFSSFFDCTGTDRLDFRYSDSDTVALYKSNAGASHTSVQSGINLLDNTILNRPGVAQARSNLYFASSDGVYRAASASSTAIAKAGAISTPLGQPTGSLSTSGSTQAIQGPCQVAYRFVIGHVDDNGNRILSEPSGRLVLTASTAALYDGSLTMSINEALTGVTTTHHFYQLYRSLESADASTPPGDELFLVYEGNFTSAGSVTVTDNYPSTLLSEPLYTNPKTGEGITQANSKPPRAVDSAVWKERLWLGNTALDYTIDLTLLGVDTTASGLQTGDKLVLVSASHGYAYGGTGTLDGAYLRAGTDFTISAASTVTEKVRDTAKNLVNTLFTSNANIAWSGYLNSSETDLTPGKFRIINAENEVFYVAASRPASWLPGLPSILTVSSASRTSNVVTVTTSASHGLATGDSVFLFYNTTAISPGFAGGVKSVTVTGAATFTYAESGSDGAMTTIGYDPYVFKILNTATATNDRAVNRVYYSKYNEPEAFPLLNYVDVGSKNSKILRISPLKDRLFVFKEDGIYTITGEAPDLRVDLFDDTTWLIAADSLATVNGKIYGLTNQGYVEISESGVAIISQAINHQLFEDDLTGLPASPQQYLTGVKAVGKEKDALYITTRPTLTSGTTYSSSELYVYSIRNRSWSTWTLPLDKAPSSLAAAPGSGLLHVGESTNDYTFVENNATYSSGTSDYHLNYYDSVNDSVTISSVDTSAGTMVMSGTPTGGAYSVGGLIYKGSKYGLITAVNGTTLTVRNISDFSSGSASYYRPIPVEVQPNLNPFGSPGVSKQFQAVTYHFVDTRMTQFTASLKTDSHWSATTITRPLGTHDTDYTWNDDGHIAWQVTEGSTTTTSSSPRVINARVLVPLEKQRAAYFSPGLTISEAGGLWRCAGFTVEMDAASERNSRNT